MDHRLLLCIITLLRAIISNGGPITTINPGRAQLMKDTLGWMTFRKNGKLMTDSEVQLLFLESLQNKYKTSDYYRTFVIAFEKAVLPKMTLNENDPCDPTYASMYKDPNHNMVAIGYQKKFTFGEYDKKHLPNGYQFCDYRKGLVCKASTKKCQCPEGSKMEPLDGSNPVQMRCLFQPDEICNLIDIDHGDDPKHTILAQNLPYLVFNLEKPLSCKMGYQCRFKSPDINFPRCHPNGGVPWAPPYKDAAGKIHNSWELGFGTDCTLGLIASPGSCKVPQPPEKPIGEGWGYTCYNYGPPRSLRSSNPENRTGFCAHAYGPFGITNGWKFVDYQKHYDTYFTPYITPRTVPLHGQELENFFEKFLAAIPSKGPNFKTVQASSKDEPCNQQRTQKWEDVWRYFSSLEGTPPPGGEYVSTATKTNLNAMLQQAIDLITTGSGKMCKVYHSFYREKPGNPLETFPSLKCEGGFSDTSGNDGKCKEPGNLDTVNFAERVQFFQDSSALIELAEYNEYEIRNDILREYPETPIPECKPEVRKPAGGGRRRRRDISTVDPNPDGSCPSGYICYYDYGDDHGIYNKKGICKIRDPPPKLYYSCLNASESYRHNYGRCEEEEIKKLVPQEWAELVGVSNLERESPCDYTAENEIRELLKPRFGPRISSDYKIMGTLLGVRLSGKRLCDATKLLECTANKVCECIEDSQPRTVTVGGTEYKSDYCYMNKGWCSTANNPDRLSLSDPEKEIFRVHYGRSNSPRHGCDDTNICVFVDFIECTTDPTGKTGYDLMPAPPTTTTTTTTTEGTNGGIKPKPTLPHNPPTAGGSGKRFAGGSGDLRGNKMVITTFSLGWSVFMIMVTTFYMN